MSTTPPDWVLAQRLQVGRRIRDLREARGLSQERLAFDADLHRHTVYRTELGTHSASLDALAQIAAALGVPLRELIP